MIFSFPFMYFVFFFCGICFKLVKTALPKNANNIFNNSVFYVSSVLVKMVNAASKYKPAAFIVKYPLKEKSK